MTTLSHVLAIAACFVGAAPSAFAHGDAKPKYGGLMNFDGETDIELIVKGRSATLCLEDHGTPLASKGASGKLEITRGKDQWTSAITPAKGNCVKTSLPRTLKTGDKVFALVELGDKNTVVARFNIP